MTVADKLILGLSTAINGMGIVFLVLIVLWAIIVVEAKLLSYFKERFSKFRRVDFSKNVNQVEIDKKDITSHQSVVSGVVDDETRAIIMAVVSNYADVPLSKLEFKSIKAV